jgi:hypothetical protein
LGEAVSVLEPCELNVYKGVRLDVFDTVILLDTELVVVCVRDGDVD